MAVIELAKPGQEATTFELIISVGNAALLMNSVIATQLLTPLKSTACNDENQQNCSNDSVNVSSPQAFNATNGPFKYTVYMITLMSISIIACLVFTPFLPRSVEDCHALKERGEKLGQSSKRGYFALFISMATLSVSLFLFLCSYLLIFFNNFMKNIYFNKHNTIIRNAKKNNMLILNFFFLFTIAVWISSCDFAFES
jgi:hypothetical protein